MRDVESSLQRYICIRERIPALFLLVAISVSAGCLLLLWDNASYHTPDQHIQVIQKHGFSAYVHALQKGQIFWPIVAVIAGSISAGLIAGFLSIMPWLKRPDRMTWLYVKDGSEVYDKARAGVKALNKKVGIWKKRGIEIYRGAGGKFRLPYDLESKHILYLGSVGSGKTASMLHAIRSIVERGDKAIIYDYKGDITQWLGGRDDVSLIAFADQRSEPWHISRDIHNSLLARELAQTIIKETSEPVWGDNARDVLAGVIEYLIENKSDRWGFQDVSELLKEDGQELAKKLKSIDHGAANTIDKPKGDKTAASIMSTLRSGAWIFDVLAQAWGNPTDGFSVRDWLRDEQPDKPLIILRSYPELSAVSNWLLSIMFNQLFGEVLSLTDSRERRIWAVIDELATLPKMPRMEECLVASRSKGFRFICGIQNFSSMRERYGRDTAQTMFSQFATRIICRLVDADTASALAADIGGDRRVVRADVKLHRSIDSKGNSKKEWGATWHERVEPTMLNNAIMNLPDPTEAKRVHAWLHIADFPIAKLEWQFLSLKATAAVDEPVPWLNEMKHKQPPQPSQAGHATQEPFKPKPFPKGGKLSKPLSSDDDFDDLDNLPDLGVDD